MNLVSNNETDPRLAYRLHVLELNLKTVCILFFWETSFPEETIFKFVKPVGTSSDLTSISRSQIPAVYQHDAPTLYSHIWIREWWPPSQKWLLGILGAGEDFPWWVGGKGEQKKGITYAIQHPGTDSHAHCSVDFHKAIYTLKLTLLLHQFPNLP